MLSFRLTITASQRQALDRQLTSAQRLGDLRLVKFILTVFAVAHYQETQQAALVLQLSVAQVEAYVHKFLCYGVRGVAFKKPAGRRPKLTTEQQRELCRLIEAGPPACGFSGACWRSPMIQQLIKERFAVQYSVFYIAELLKHLGFTYQKAAFVSDHLDEVARQRFCRRVWPEMVRLARAKKALLLFGDEASFPQWGTLTYTWARRGTQPVVKTRLLKSLGFSYQKAAFVSDHLDEVARRRFSTRVWPDILRQAREKKALLLFGDEASFPQWGTLTYTWARRGTQPVVKTSGKRRGWKVFGLLDYFTGRFFHQGLEGRFTSASYTAFLARVLEQTSGHVMLIQDGARYHTSAETKRFCAAHAARLTVYQLPSYSPDYNPIEKLWKKIKQAETHLHYFPTFGALSAKVEQALLKFENAPREILALCSLPEELAWAA